MEEEKSTSLGRLLVIIFILIALFIIGALFLFFSYQKEHTVVTTLSSVSQEIEKKEKTETEKEAEKELEAVQSYNDREVFKEALSLEDEDICKSVNNKNLQDECWDAIMLSSALKGEGEKNCKRIRDEDRKQYCIDELILVHAKERNIFAECPNIKSESIRNQCYEIEARQKLLSAKNIEECKNIYLQNEKERCKNFFVSRIIQEEKEPNEDICLYLEENKQDDCLLEIAVKKASQNLDASYCSDLVNKENAEICQKELEYQLTEDEMIITIESGSYESCDNIEDQGMQIFCRERSLIIRAQKEYRPRLCLDIENEDTQKECLEKANAITSTYYYDIARTKNDIRWCDRIPEEQSQTSCKKILKSEKE